MMNSEIKRLGLKLILWVASVLLSGKLTAKEKEEFEHLQTSLSVIEREIPEE